MTTNKYNIGDKESFEPPSFVWFKTTPDGEKFLGLVRNVRTQGFGFEYHVSSLDPKIPNTDFFNVPQEFLEPVGAVEAAVYHVTELGTRGLADE